MPLLDVRPASHHGASHTRCPIVQYAMIRLAYPLSLARCPQRALHLPAGHQVSLGLEASSASILWHRPSPEAAKRSSVLFD